MKKRSVFAFFLLILSVSGNAQPTTAPSAGKNSLATLNLHFPVGIFARSHFAGPGLNYSWSHKRFGRNIVSKKPGLILDAGGDYYFGKKIRVAGHDFRYDGYLYTHAMPGIMFNPWLNAHIGLTAGPTMGIYSGNIDLGWGANLFAAYFFKKNLSIGPAITYKKHSKTDALWGGAGRISFCF